MAVVDILDPRRSIRFGVSRSALLPLEQEGKVKIVVTAHPAAGVIAVGIKDDVVFVPFFRDVDALIQLRLTAEDELVVFALKVPSKSRLFVTNG
jgi:hypothetical protein